jgi:hypothetical protein
MADTATIAPDYTGHEPDPNQKVSVWELTPPLGTSYDLLWLKSHAAAVQWVEDHYDELVEKIHDATQAGGGSVTVKIERVETTAEEALGVFENGT